MRAGRSVRNVNGSLTLTSVRLRLLAATVCSREDLMSVCSQACYNHRHASANRNHRHHNSPSGVTIGRARRAVHAGPALWGAQNLPDAVFFKFLGEEGALLEYLHAGPLQPCYATELSIHVATFLSAAVEPDGLDVNLWVHGSQERGAIK